MSWPSITKLMADSQNSFNRSSNIKEIVKAPDWPDFVDDYPNLVLDILNKVLMVKTAKAKIFIFC